MNSTYINDVLDGKVMILSINMCILQGHLWQSVTPLNDYHCKHSCFINISFITYIVNINLFYQTGTHTSGLASYPRIRYGMKGCTYYRLQEHSMIKISVMSLNI